VGLPVHVPSQQVSTVPLPAWPPRIVPLMVGALVFTGAHSAARTQVVQALAAGAQPAMLWAVTVTRNVCPA